MNQAPGLARRHFLRGLGAAVGLPALESLRPVMAATPGNPKASQALRLAYLYIPNGVNLEHWRSKGSGKNYQLGKSMKSLEGLRDEF